MHTNTNTTPLTYMGYIHDMYVCAYTYTTTNTTPPCARGYIVMAKTYTYKACTYKAGTPYIYGIHT